MLAVERLAIPKRILVVDDEASIRDFCSRVLTRAGYQVLIASSGEEALNRLRQGPVDMVISDIRMPNVSGLEILQGAKALYPSISVVLITGFGTAQTIDRARQAGADHILTKPFNHTELLEAVREVLPTDAESR